MIDIKKVREEAEKEVGEEKIETAKRQVKQKMKEIETARKIVRNLERELDDIYATIGE